MREQEPAVFLKAACNLDDDILADRVEFGEFGDGGAHGHERGVDSGNHFGDDLVGLLEPGGQLGCRRFGSDGLDARVDRQTKGDDSLRGGVGVVAGVLDDLIEEFVNRLKVGTSYVPVRLLAIDVERGQVGDDGTEKLCDSGRDVGVS